MREGATTAKRTTQVRFGRPKREFAGEVELRILEAAKRVFLMRGFEGATIDEIAEEAGAGKPTIYARYAGKEALFYAVISRTVRENMDWKPIVPAGTTTEERLKTLGALLSERVLTPESVDLMRATAAEARRFPDLAAAVHRMIRERGAETIARLLGEFAEGETTASSPAFADDRLHATARRFAELVIAPMTMRALFGEDPATLRAEIALHVEESVAFFLAAVGAKPFDEHAPQKGSPRGARRARRWPPKLQA